MGKLKTRLESFHKDGGDKVIWFVVIALAICSMILIYSAASNQLFSPTERHVIWPYLTSHGVFLLLGLFLVYCFEKIDYRRYAPWTRVCYLVALILLLCTILLGSESGGAHRSLAIFGHEFQTFYVVVLLVILYAAHSLARMGDSINDIRKVYLPFLCTILIPVLGLMTQNVSTGLILLITCFFMLFISKLKFSNLAITVGVMVVACGILIAASGFGISALSRFATVHNRMERFFSGAEQKDVKTYVAEMRDADIDNIRQDVQLEGAVSTGGILPVNGPGSSIYSKTPQIYSDCIFALAVEEYGVLISSLLILIYLLLFYRIFLMVRHVPTPFGVYLAGGLGFWIVFQAFVHISVCTGVIPNTGQTLPMVSWGNVSIIVTSVCFGILLNISKSKKRKTDGHTDTKGVENE